jgi:hypothetical protein
MQQLADITWADGQVWMAARDYIHNRDATTEALRLAASAYQGILQTTDNERLINRAHLGLARIYEMQNDLEKAREEYLKVTGGYALFAREQADRLELPETKDTYAWLSTAQAPRPSAPSGPGTPGQPPDFSTDEFPLPGEATDSESPGDTSTESVEDLLKRFDLGFPDSDEKDRYQKGEDQSAKDSTSPPAEPEVKEGEQSAPATDEKSVE